MKKKKTDKNKTNINIKKNTYLEDITSEESTIIENSKLIEKEDNKKEFNLILKENKINISSSEDSSSYENDENDNKELKDNFIDTDIDDDRISIKHNKIKINYNKFATITTL